MTDAVSPGQGLPPAGRPGPEVLAELRARRAGAVAPAPSEVRTAAAQAYVDMLDLDCADPDDVPGVVALEQDVVAAVAGRLGGDDATRGVFTGGGTESIMLAVKAARDLRPQISRPRLVVPVTAHPAFAKAAAYLGLALHQVQVDPETCRPDMAEVRAALTEDTVLLGVSAPCAPFGVIDPVAELAPAAAAAGVDCHVDACTGGWLLPWLAAAGADVPAFDLSVPGVTSLSCDLHKFGDVPKSASVVLFADDRHRRAAFFSFAGWSGYTVVSTTVQGGRSAGPLAAAWTVLQMLGDQGHVRRARDVREADRAFREGLARVPGLRVVGAPTPPLFALAATDPELDVFVVADEARARGLPLGPQHAYAGLPDTVRITLRAEDRDRVPAILEVLADAVRAARETGPARPDAGLVEALAQLDFAALSDADLRALLAAVLGDEDAGATTTGGPRRAALLNRLLGALSPAAREAARERHLSLLYARAPRA